MFMYLTLFLFSSIFEFGGNLKLDTRMLIENHNLSYNESRLDFYLKASNDNMNFFTNFWIMDYALKEINNINDLIELEKLSLEAKEMYISIPNFPVSFMDIKLGKQRTSWGTSYVFNPTDNIDALDLQDIWDFERRIASFSLKTDIFLKDFRLQSVFTPYFTPTRLNTEILEIIYNKDTLITEYEYTFNTPEKKIENSLYGLRVKRNILGNEFSISYSHTRSSIPLPKRVVNEPTLSGLKSKVELVYPMLDVIGFDFSIPINKFTFWGEFGYFIPESLICKIENPFTGISDSVILSDNYYKYVFGGDYSVNNDIRILIQYVYGFPYEAGSNLNDFVLLHSSLKLFDSKIQLMLNYAFEIIDFEKKEFSQLLSPEFSIYPISNIKVSFGSRLIFGDEGNFGKLNNKEHIYLTFKYNY